MWLDYPDLNYPINNSPSPSLPAQSDADGLAIQKFY